MEFKAENGSMDSKNYLRLKDKESVKGVFAGEPYSFRRHWVVNKSVPCTEDLKCPHCIAGLRATFSFRINFLIKENDNYVCKIFEQGWSVYQLLKQINSEYDLEKHIVKISREGSGPNDTNYTILPVPNGLIKDDLAKKLIKIELHDLKHKVETETQHSKQTESPASSYFEPIPTFDSDEELPF